MDLKSKIRNIPDFPQKGVMFRDVTTLLKDPEAFRYSIQKFKEYYQGKKIDVIVGPESRGFIFGAVLAYKLGISFVPIRKPGKLPHKTISAEFEKEYGKDKMEIHEDAIKKGQKVLVIDDLIATGGTISAATKLIEQLGGEIVECTFIIELPELKGREKIKGYKIFTMIEFEGE